MNDSGTVPPTPALQRLNNETILLPVDETVYGLEAIFKTCYLFTDRCYLFLSRLPASCIAVQITAKQGGVPLEQVTGEFCNELINQRIRADIAQETGKIRELIVAKALAEGNLLEIEFPHVQEGEAALPTSAQDDYQRDPLVQFHDTSWGYQRRGPIHRTRKRA